MEPLTAYEAKLVFWSAEENLNATEIARRAYVHRNTIMYHLGKIERKTGLSPLSFYDLCDLLPIADKRLEELVTGNAVINEEERDANV